MLLECPHNWYRDTMVATESNERGVCPEYLSRRLFRTSIVLAVIHRFRGNVAAIHDSNVLAVEQGATQVEVVVVERVVDVHGRLPDGIRGTALVVSHRLRVIRHTEGNAEDGDISLEIVEVWRKVEN